MRYFVCLFLAVICGISTGTSAIYDCFMFNNELEILELRLKELYDHVDKFVLVESTESHRLGTSKPCYFELNQDRFKQYSNKIIHIKLNEQIITDNGWIRENWQRNQIMRGLTECKPEDLILISDVDEFIPGKIIDNLYKKSAYIPMIGFLQKMYRFFLNRSTNQIWSGTAALRFKHLLLTTPQEVRNRVRCAQMMMWQAGWHFTSMGGYERCREKYYNIVEGYDGIGTFEEWRTQVDTLTLVTIDNTYPKYVQANIELLTKQGLIDNL